MATRPLDRLHPELLVFLKWQQGWVDTARTEQLPPEDDWAECGYVAGRGWGKTRVGAEWLGRVTYEQGSVMLPSAVVAPTQNDARFTCFEGVTGLLNVIPPELVTNYNSSDITMTLVNGATIRGFSAEKPARLRGPQFQFIWCDELAAWQDAETTWDMAKMGLRLGPHPKVLWTTTPRPTEIVRKLTAKRERRVIISGTTFDNRANLPEDFFTELTQYDGTKIGRQELYGEIIDPEEAGIIKRSWFRLWPANKPLPEFTYIVMSLDTAYTEKTLDKAGDPDFSACTVWGTFRLKDGHWHVILLDCWSERYGFPELIRRVRKEMNVAYGDDQDTALIRPLVGSAKPLTSGRKPDIILIEDKGSGISLRQVLERENIPAYGYNPGRADKLSRLHVVSPVFARRMVWLPESAKLPGRPRTWVEPLLAQLCTFTGTGSIKHDDYVDSTTQSIRLLMDKRLIDVVNVAKLRDNPPPPRVTPSNPYTA